MIIDMVVVIETEVVTEIVKEVVVVETETVKEAVIEIIMIIVDMTEDPQGIDIEVEAQEDIDKWN